MRKAGARPEDLLSASALDANQSQHSQSSVAGSHCSGISNCGLGSASKVERNLAGQNWFGGRNRNNGVFESCTADTVPSGWGRTCELAHDMGLICVPQDFW